MTTASPTNDTTAASLIEGIKDGSIVPYLGPQVLKGPNSYTNRDSFRK